MCTALFCICRKCRNYIRAFKDKSATMSSQCSQTTFLVCSRESFVHKYMEDPCAIRLRCVMDEQLFCGQRKMLKNGFALGALGFPATSGGIRNICSCFGSRMLLSKAACWWPACTERQGFGLAPQTRASLIALSGTACFDRPCVFRTDL